MAVIDQTYYRGTDAYSDGDEAENEILEIVRSGKGLGDLESASWPALYHLSPVRENICSWYPFRPGSRVLEVGAGCGAVTGALCGRGLEVTSADLSLRRSTINYERHKDCDELCLMVGNLHEMSFPELFDYVLLIGVLEYAGKFSEGEKPYQNFLRHIRSLMKPDGKLLVAIENRLGLKYFAGAPEDHLGVPFAGLRGYDPQAGIRTFSRGELSGLLEKSGFPEYRFYYPYPDYKFPLEIFTDSTLASQHYGKPFQVFDRERLDLFTEGEIASALAEDGAAGALANSFLVEASPEKNALSAERTFYVKLNSGRKEDFRIGTRIFGGQEPTLVSKYALTETAEAHVRRMTENEERIGQFRKVLRGDSEGPEVRYAWKANSTLEDVLRSAERDGDANAIRGVFEKIRELALMKKTEPAEEETGFISWFGEKKLNSPTDLYTLPADIDLVPDNVFVDGEELILSDCEWVTDFPVPVSFILWRSMEYAWLRLPGLESVVSREELQRDLGIRDEDIPVFREWSWHFENRYVAGDDYTRFAKPIRVTDISPLQAEEMKQLIRNQEGHIEQLLQSERELKGKVSNQEGHIEQLLQSERELKGQVVNQEAHIEELKNNIRCLEAQLNEMINSRSWKLTEPLRRLQRKIDGNDTGKQE